MCHALGGHEQCSLLDEVGFLQVRLMHEHGYVLGNLDATIILQRPKLSPHKETIRANLCRLLDAHPSVINIKVRCSNVAWPSALCVNMSVTEWFPALCRPKRTKRWTALAKIAASQSTPCAC